MRPGAVRPFASALAVRCGEQLSCGTHGFTAARIATQVEEKRRRLYVAMTRPRDRVTVVAVQLLCSGGGHRRPSCLSSRNRVTRDDLNMVEKRRIELPTSALRTQRSPS